jgi:hypothetical protein
MFIESPRIRKFFNASLLANQPADVQVESSAQPQELSPENPTWDPPANATVPLNPVPALTILLLGIIMGAHQQETFLATQMHAAWGALFVFAAVSRLGTYLLNYVRPPVSYLPSRPPTEILAGFSLTAGGFLFMVSQRDIVDAMEAFGGDVMVAFTVGMGVTALICSGVVWNVAAKGWAVSREHISRVPAAALNLAA